jgi:hypothetical protein
MLELQTVQRLVWYYVVAVRVGIKGDELTSCYSKIRRGEKIGQVCYCCPHAWCEIGSTAKTYDGDANGLRDTGNRHGECFEV